MVPYSHVSVLHRFVLAVASFRLLVPSVLVAFVLVVPGTKWVSADELPQQVVQQTDESSQEAIRAEADRLFDEARELYQQSWQQALLKFEEARRLYQAIGDEKLQARTLVLIGLIYLYQGEYEKAIDPYEQSLLIFQKLGDRQGEANSRGNLGNIYNFLGNYQKAIESYQQSLNIFQELGDRSGEANSQMNLGNYYQDRGDEEKAREFYQKSLNIFQEIGDRHGESKSLGNLGNYYRDRGEYEKAFDLYQKSLRIDREIGNQPGEAHHLFNLAVVYRNQNNFTEALDSINKDIHLATHGFFDETNPERSGLVLSQFDAAGNPQRGYLRLGDLFNLNLSAEMVVLSACQTALGENVRGEGIVGVTRGLMYAGASRVVASLWNVDDEATAELMEQLYRQILIESASPASALSATQRALWQQGQSPYLWAAFTLQGEWR